MEGLGQNMGGLDRERERQVAIQARDSLFHIEVNPKYLLVEEAEPKPDATYKRITEDVTDDEVSRGIKRSPDSIIAGTKERYSSGFAISEKGNILRILTCAHTIEDAFTDGIHSVTVEEVNTMFRFDVHCTHHEDGIIKMASHLKPSERLRRITPAWAVAINTELDLLVLDVDVRRLKGNNKECCSDKHPSIQLSESNPSELEKLILVGWPPQRSKSLAVGQVSYCGWTYDAISSYNVKGFDMKSLEVHGMVASHGFSGAPIVNGHCKCVALFHGVFNGMTGYGVSLKDIEAFLHKHKMFDWDGDEDDEDEEGKRDSDYKMPMKEKVTPMKKRTTPMRKRTNVKDEDFYDEGSDYNEDKEDEDSDYEAPMQKKGTPLKRKKTTVKKGKTR